MPRLGLSAGEIKSRAIAAAMERIRKQGLEKMRLIDVARDIGLSHAALYLHFADKQALFDAIVETWLRQLYDGLGGLAETDAPPDQVLLDWFVQRYQRKREKALGDPEMYRAFHAAYSRRKVFMVAHLAAVCRELAGLLRRIPELPETTDFDRLAAVLYDGLSSFHHPLLVADRAEIDRTGDLELLFRVLMAGMLAVSKTPPGVGEVA